MITTAGAPRTTDGVAELMRSVTRITLESRKLTNDVLAGAYLSVFRGTGVEFDDVREYAEGDDPRSVDWNVTARQGRPFVKRFTDERDLSVVFLLDVSRSMEGGFGTWSARETAARLIACLGLSAVRHHDKTGLIAFADGVVHQVAPKKGTNQVLRLVRDALALKPVAARADPALALRRAARTLPRHAILFLISDFLAGSTGNALAEAQRRHDVIAVRLLMPELTPPASGLMHCLDPATGRHQLMDWSDERVRMFHAARMAERRSSVQRELRRGRTDLIDVVVPPHPGRGTILRPLLRFFHQRALRGATR